MILLTANGCTWYSASPLSVVSGPVGYEAPGVISYPPELIREVAAALRARGLYGRKPVYGLAMQNSLRLFQYDQGLTVTGRIDRETLRALKVAPVLLAGEEGQPLNPEAAFLSRLAARAGISSTGRLSVPEAKEPLSGVPAGNFSARGDLFHAAAPVAALVNGQGVFCTGFLIGPDTMLTSSSCLAAASQCEQISARFSFQDDARGRPLPTVDYRCQEIMEIGGLVDYALLRLEGEPGFDWGYLELSERPATEDEPVAVIGHRAGIGKIIHDDCRMAAGVGAAVADMAVACGTELEVPGAPVLSRWSNRVLALVPQGKTPPATTTTVLPMERLLAKCRGCDSIQISSKPLTLSTSEGVEYLLPGPRGLVLIRETAEGFVRNELPPDWLSKWNLHGKYQAHAADINGDGLDDLILHNSGWLAIFESKRGKPRLHWISHDRVGGWRLSSADRAWPGDFNGNGRTDLLLFNGNRLGLLLADGEKLVFSWQSGPQLGEWRFDPGDKFYIGDFNGDGSDEILVRKGEMAAVLAWRGNRLEPIWLAVSRLGPWQLHGADDHYLGDFTGDGSQEVLVRRGQQISLWKMIEDQLRLQWMQRVRWGSWPLGWQDRLVIADFNGDGRDDVLIRSHKGIALQLFNGRYFATSWIRFDRFEGWNLTRFDRELLGGLRPDGKSTILIFNPWTSGRFLFSGTGLVREKGLEAPPLSPDPGGRER